MRTHLIFLDRRWSPLGASPICVFYLSFLHSACRMDSTCGGYLLRDLQVRSSRRNLAFSQSIVVIAPWPIKGMLFPVIKKGGRWLEQLTLEPVTWEQPSCPNPTWIHYLQDVGSLASGQPEIARTILGFLGRIIQIPPMKEWEHATMNSTRVVLLTPIFQCPCTNN
jgi:hypothetical protein